MNLATFGAYVALILAVFKVAEFFRDRKPKVSVIRMLRGISDLGHDLLLTNASKVPATIYYYELIWLEPSILTKCFGFRRKHVGYEFSLEDNLCDISIDGYSHYMLNFSDEHHFDWGPNIKKDLYLVISMVGRPRPLWLWIAGPKTWADKATDFVQDHVFGSG